MGSYAKGTKRIASLIARKRKATTRQVPRPVVPRPAVK